MGNIKKNLALAVVAFALGNLGWLVLIYTPKQAQLRELHAKINDLSLRVAGLVAQDRQIADVEAEIDSTQKKIAHLEQRIYHKGQLRDMIRIIEQRGTLYGLRCSSIMPDYDALLRVDAKLREELGPLVILPVEFTLQGDFIDFGRFVESVDTLPFLFSISKLNVEATAESYPQVMVRMEGVLYLTESPLLPTPQGESQSRKVSGLPATRASEGTTLAKA